MLQLNNVLFEERDRQVSKLCPFNGISSISPTKNALQLADDMFITNGKIPIIYCQISPTNSCKYRRSLPLIASSCLMGVLSRGWYREKYNGKAAILPSQSQTSCQINFDNIQNAFNNSQLHIIRVEKKTNINRTELQSQFDKQSRMTVQQETLQWFKFLCPTLTLFLYIYVCV